MLLYLFRQGGVTAAALACVADAIDGGDDRRADGTRKSVPYQAERPTYGQCARRHAYSPRRRQRLAKYGRITRTIGAVLITHPFLLDLRLVG